MAWDAALDLGIRRLADACFSRAIHGEAVPHYYKGELVGEHRRYDSKLAMFLLRYRDPLRYAASLDQMVYSGHHEGAGVRFARARNAVADEAEGLADGEQLGPAPPYAMETIADAAARPPEPPVPTDPDPGVARIQAHRVECRRAEQEAADARFADTLARMGERLDRAEAEGHMRG